MLVTDRSSFHALHEVGNLVEDDEWLGLGMELAIVMRSAVRETVKKNVSAAGCCLADARVVTVNIVANCRIVTYM